MPSPLTYPWTPNDVLRIVEAEPNLAADLRRLWDGPCYNKPENLFVRALSIVYGARRSPKCEIPTRLFIDKVEATINHWSNGNLSPATTGQTQEEFWSHVFLVMNPTGWGVFTDNVSRALREVTQNNPANFNHYITYTVIDIGSMYRLLSDYLALQEIVG